MRARSLVVLFALSGCFRAPGGASHDGGATQLDAGPGAQGFDAGPSDMDAGAPDSGGPDAGAQDAGSPDAGPPDAGAPDAGAPDAGRRPRVDAGFPELPLAGCRPQLTAFAQPELDMPEAIQGVATLRMAPDGAPNLAVTTARGLYLVRRAPDGGFEIDASPRVEVAGSTPVVGDWNGDGLPDLAYCASADAGLVFAFGTGDGGLEAVVLPDAGPCSVVTLSDDPEGRDELLVIDRTGLDLWHVQDDGGARPVASRAATGLYGAIGFDLDRDGRGDPVYVRDELDGGMTLVEVTSGAQRLDGEIDAPLPPPSGSSSDPLRRGRAIADFDGDGRPDVVLGSDPWTATFVERAQLDVLLQRADGGFVQSSVITDVAGWALPLVAEVDGNDWPDVVVVDGWNQAYEYSNRWGISGQSPPALGFQLFYGDGQGGFTTGPLDVAGYPEIPQGASTPAVGLVPARLHGDDDLVCWAYGQRRAHLVVNEGDGRFFIPEPLDAQRVRSPNWPDPQPSGAFVEGVTNLNGAGAADFNGDGRVDLVSRLGVFINRGDWLQSLDAPVPVPSGFFNADLDGDGRDELVTETSVAQIFDDGGAVAREYRMESTPNLMNAQSLVQGRFSGAGLQMVSAEKPDGTLKLWELAIDGGVSGPTTFSVDAGATWLVSADFDEDGVPDLAAIGTQVLVFCGGDGGLHQVLDDSATQAAAYPALGWASVGDFDGDGHADFAFRSCSYSSSCGQVLYLGSGDGGFNRIAQDAQGGLVGADLDADGRAELVDENNGIWSWQGGDAGLVLKRTLLGQGSHVIVPKAADFDGDGRLDVISHGWLIRNACRDLGR